MIPGSPQISPSPTLTRSHGNLHRSRNKTAECYALRSGAEPRESCCHFDRHAAQGCACFHAPQSLLASSLMGTRYASGSFVAPVLASLFTKLMKSTSYTAAATQHGRFGKAHFDTQQAEVFKGVVQGASDASFRLGAWDMRLTAPGGQPHVPRPRLTGSASGLSARFSQIVPSWVHCGCMSAAQEARG